MERKHYIWLLVLVVVLVAVFAGAPIVVSRLKLGARVGPATVLKDNRYIERDPIDLSSAAGVPLREYSLARMLASEVSQKNWTAAEAIAKGWVVLNDVKSRPDLWKGDVFKLITYSTNPDHRGRYGRQAGRRYSSANDPHERDLTIARALLRGDYPDPTGGAVKYMDPKAFAGQPGATGTAEEKHAEWTAQGLRRVPVSGVPDTWFYINARKALVA